MTNFYHTYDLPDDVTFDGDLAVDTEAMGLHTLRDRLCVVQISDGKGDAHVVHFPKAKFDAPNLKKLLRDASRVKLMHFARFDVAILHHYLGVDCTPIYCTKTASRMCRTYTNRHGFKDLCKELLGVDISKQKQSSHWGADVLDDEQIAYAADDVLYLHRLRDELKPMLEKENRVGLHQRVCNAINVRAEMDILGWINADIFAHDWEPR